MAKEEMSANEEYIDVLCPNCREEISFLKDETDFACPWCNTKIDVKKTSSPALQTKIKKEQEQEKEWEAIDRCKKSKSPIAKVLRIVYYILFLIAIIVAGILGITEDINLLPYVLIVGFVEAIFVEALASILDYLAKLTYLVEIGIKNNSAK